MIRWVLRHKVTGHYYQSNGFLSNPVSDINTATIYSSSRKNRFSAPVGWSWMKVTLKTERR